MKHPYSSLPAHWLPRPLAALGLLLATAGAVQAQTATFALQANLPSTGAYRLAWPLPTSTATAGPTR